MHIIHCHLTKDSQSKKKTTLLCVSAAEQTTVTTEELTQHKNYLKVIKRQERDMKAAEKKYQKKAEDLIQKYSDSFKVMKKKVSKTEWGNLFISTNTGYKFFFFNFGKMGDFKKKRRTKVGSGVLAKEGCHVIRVVRAICPIVYV